MFKHTTPRCRFPPSRENSLKPLRSLLVPLADQPMRQFDGFLVSFARLLGLPGLGRSLGLRPPAIVDLTTGERTEPHVAPSPPFALRCVGGDVKRQGTVAPLASALEKSVHWLRLGYDITRSPFMARPERG
jgi:hypothetical protein